MAKSPAVLEYGQGDTWQIGGSRFALLSNYPLNPIGYGAQQEAVPYALPSVPPVYGQQGGAIADPSIMAANQASAAPLHPKWSPLPWVIVGIFGAVLGLHWLHWHDKRGEEAA